MAKEKGNLGSWKPEELEQKINDEGGLDYFFAFYADADAFSGKLGRAHKAFLNARSELILELESNGVVVD